MSDSYPKPADLPLDQEDWDALPEHVQRILGAYALIQQTRLAALQDRVSAQEERIRELEARLDQDSSNSSRPPSSDPPWKDKQKDKRKQRQGKRRRGGQKGHKGSRRETIPPEKVTSVEEHRPEVCECCGESLAEAPMVEGNHRRQVVEIPPIEPEVYEHRIFGATCSCGHETWGSFPAEAMFGCGPRLTALTAQLSGRYRLSRQETAALLSEVLGVPICKGTVQACCERVSDALAEPVDEVAAALPDQDVVHMDETGWKVAGKRAWLWVFSSATFAYFAIDPRRGRAILERLFPGGHPGTVNSDRWSAYSFFSALRRQLCWSHLLRDMKGIVDAKGLGSRPAKPILKAADRMFSDWHAFRRGEITRAELAERIAPLRVSLMVFAEAGAGQKKDRKWRGLGRDLIRYQAAVFRFVDVEGVEPTNNQAERDIRPAVLWRKGSQGTRSENGSLFVSRMLTTAATCRRQGHRLLDFLERAVLAHQLGEQPPSLLTLAR